MFSYVSLESTVPEHHPLWKIRKLADKALRGLDDSFDDLYATEGRPSIPPERLLKASLLQVFYSIHSERQLMEQLDYNLLFRWFVGLSVDEPVCDRLAQADVGKRLFDEIVWQARKKGLTSNEHFSVDGTLIAAWASQKSVRRKDGNDDDNPNGVGCHAGRNFHGERRCNETHASRTDPEALLASKSRGIAARPSYAGHTLMENRNGLLVDAELIVATGTAERDTAVAMAAKLRSGSTIGADKAYDTYGFVVNLRSLGLVPHVSQNLNRRGGSTIDGRTTRHPGNEVSQRIRKRIEQPFGWAKEVGGWRQTKLRGLERVR